ncbi:MAG TPA: sialidase family protein, partial [Abditibacteriaceae bacterium]|nr:sialidase family protein [Abditibacteriaceae bacterium]
MQSDLQRVEGFNAIIAAPNECSFAFQRRGVDYRGPAPGYWTGAWWVPEELEKNEIIWETAPCPEQRDTLFLYVAASAPTPPDFARGPQARLYVNDEYCLTFDLGIARDKTWKSGEWELSYASKYVQWPFDGYDRRFEMMGNSGLYSLKVPARAIASGQPCRVKIEILPFPRWPRTWFMIKERRDTLQEDHTSEEVAQLRAEVNQLKQLVHILAVGQYSAALGRESLQHQVVYSDGYRHLLSPDLAKLSNGDWLLCFRVGAEHTSLDGDVLILRSHDEGRTWGEVHAAAATPDLDEREGG